MIMYICHTIEKVIFPDIYIYILICIYNTLIYVCRIWLKQIGITFTETWLKPLCSRQLKFFNRCYVFHRDGNGPSPNAEHRLPSMDSATTEGHTFIVATVDGLFFYNPLLIFNFYLYRPILLCLNVFRVFISEFRVKT